MDVIYKEAEALAIVSFIDGAGNENITLINYFPKLLTVESDYDGTDTISVGDDIEYEFIITNESNKEVVIDSIYLENSDNGFKLVFDTDLLPINLEKSQEINFTIGFDAMQSRLFTNKVKIETNCDQIEVAEINILVGSLGATLYHYQFGNVFIGDSAIGDIKISNSGSLRLRITEILPPSNEVFSLDLPMIDEQNPLYIEVGWDTSFQIIFKPISEEYYLDSVVVSASPNLMNLSNIITGNGLINSVNGSEDNDMNLLIIPNPARDVISVRFNNIEYGIHSVIIINMEGNPVIISEKWDLNELGQNTIDVDIGQLPQGAYYVQVEFNGKQMTGKFTVVR